MTETFKDKFVAFIDVIGFKDMVMAAEAGRGRSLAELKGILGHLNRDGNKAFFREDGPEICPCSTCISRDLDFEVTQVSDCAVLSAEVSPAGIINLVHSCLGATLALLGKGVMVRGYITRGSIAHAGNTIIGTGYQTAYERESKVSAFKREADERGTPFIEVDPVVCAYVQAETDECVREMFSRMVKADNEVVALFPFTRIAPAFIVGSFDAAKQKAQNDIVRSNLLRMKEAVMFHIDPANKKALKKVRHYVAALDAQLAACDRSDHMIAVLAQPAAR